LVTVAITATLYLLRAGHNVRTVTYKTALLDLRAAAKPANRKSQTFQQEKQKSVCRSSQVSQPIYLQSPSHHTLLNTIMTNLIKAPVHIKPHSYHHDNRFKTSK